MMMLVPQLKTVKIVFLLADAVLSPSIIGLLTRWHCRSCQIITGKAVYTAMSKRGKQHAQIAVRHRQTGYCETTGAPRRCRWVPIDTITNPRGARAANSTIPPGGLERMSYTTDQLSDLQCIRDAALRYCRGVDRLDLAVMQSAYWPEATDDHGVFCGNAWEFCELCMEAHQPWRSTSHCIYNHSIELEADGVHARGEIYNVTYLFQDSAEILDTWVGRYLDRYEKRAGEWRIIERACIHEGSASRPITAMEIDANSFRQGSFDRPAHGRPLGP